MFYMDISVESGNTTPDFDFNIRLLRHSLVHKLPLCDDCSAQQVSSTVVDLPSAIGRLEPSQGTEYLYVQDFPTSSPSDNKA
jgi:hypothetical protein